jgi:hypothetical protein
MSGDKSNIHVPKFAVRVGDAALTFSKPQTWDDVWSVDMPNSLGINEDRRIRARSFDDARQYAESIASIMSDAEAQFLELQQETLAAIEGVFLKANDDYGQVDR